jgi:hypothetical protein
VAVSQYFQEAAICLDHADVATSSGSQRALHTVTTHPTDAPGISFTPSTTTNKSLVLAVIMGKASSGPGLIVEQASPGGYEDIPLGLLELAELASTHADIGRGVDIFEEALAPLSAAKLRDIANVARTLNTASFGLLLFTWIEQRLDRGLKTDNNFIHI